MPRPQLSGKSGSSSNSSIKRYSDESSSDDTDDNDDLLANCIRSGMQSLQKSKSEPLDLKKKGLSKSSSKSSLKSPRGSKVIPGVRINELKLKPTTPTTNTPPPMEFIGANMWTDQSPNDAVKQFQADPVPPAPVLPAAAAAPESPLKKIQSSMEDSSLASSICSTLDNIQPPSMMNSLISMSEKPSVPNSPKVSSQRLLECRHMKKPVVPEMVRRALDLSSSFSSCQSNLDNIKPPTEMDSSFLSIASISSEVADLKGTILDDVNPPTLMDEVSGANDKTLVPDDKTYTIDDGNNAKDDLSTCHDITDVFDESQEPTLTLGSDNNTDADVIDAPELPRDSSRESTPGTKRKILNPSTASLLEREKEFHKMRSYKVSVPSLDLEDNSLTSGYKSETPRSPKSIQRRTDDRFKTHTITRNDLNNGDSDSSSSTGSPAGRKTIRQKRQEESDRFKTQTIEPSNIIEEEAKNVLNIIAESSKNAATTRSRSASADGLLDSRILAENELGASCDSILEQDLLKETLSKVGPRIRKPSDQDEQKEVMEDKGIRGRRKGLYSPAKNNKPAIAPKPRNIVPPPVPKSRIPPGSPRGTRATQLRQITKTRLNSPPSPKSVTPKSKLRAPLASPCPSTISSSSGSSNSSRLVRQGTFTKEEPSLNNTVLVDIDVGDKKPPKRPASVNQKRSPRDSQLQGIFKMNIGFFIFLMSFFLDRSRSNDSTDKNIGITRTLQIQTSIWFKHYFEQSKHP